MSSEQKWPKWIRLLYYKGSNTGIVGYEGCANNAGMLLDTFNRLEVRMLDIVEMKVNDKKLTETEIVQFYKWLSTKRKELEENEKRKKAKQETENSHDEGGNAS
jgi:hypothetical protein